MRLDQRSFALALLLTSSGPCASLSHEREDAALAPMDAGGPVPAPDAWSPPPADAGPSPLDAGPPEPIGIDGVDLMFVPPGDQGAGLIFTFADVDADGFDDLFMYNHGYLDPVTTTSRLGSVHVVYGSATRRTGTFVLDQSDAEILGTVERSTLYFTLDHGDFDGDGVEDVVIGTVSPNEGAVRILYGARGARLSGRPNIEDVTVMLAQNDSFPWTQWGASATVGDYDGDGIDDILVVAAQYPYGTGPSPHDGRAYLVRGRRARFPTRSALAPDVTISFSPEASFQAASAIGDLDGDHHDDFLVIEQLATVDRFGLFYGPLDPATTTLAIGDAAATLELPRDPMHLGEGGFPRAFDADGDGIDELVVGSTEPPYGRLYVFRGSQMRHAGVIDPASAVVTFPGLSMQTESSIMLAAGDANGDGRSDLVVGSMEFDGFQGRADRMYGTPDLTSLAHPDQTWLGHWHGGELCLDELGGELVADADFDGDGLDDLLLGAPGRCVPSGRAFLVYGRH